MKGDDPATQVQVYQRYYALIEEVNRPQVVEEPVPAPTPEPEPQTPKLSSTSLFDLDIPTLACLAAMVVIIVRQIGDGVDEYSLVHLEGGVATIFNYSLTFMLLLGILPLVALLKRKSYAISMLLVFLITNMAFNFLFLMFEPMENFVRGVFLGLIIFGIVKSKSLKKHFPPSERTFSKYSLLIPGLYFLYWVFSCLFYYFFYFFY